MTDPDKPESGIPARFLRPVPVGAVEDAALMDRLEALAAELPSSILSMSAALGEVGASSSYDAAANRAAAYVWRSLDRFDAGPPRHRKALVAFAAQHMSPDANARILRRLAIDPTLHVRLVAHTAMRRGHIEEIALPAEQGEVWDASGWFVRRRESGRLFSHAQGARAQEQARVPVVKDVAALRALLAIKSPEQLGYFMLASDREGGPYTSFLLKKRDGSDRRICAPKLGLQLVQRRILRKILAAVPTHDAAHGFVPGRSTVTNALPHTGARVLVKFDLKDFFPTIHYHRVMGLFTSLGYTVGNTRFSTNDASTQISPALARLTTYTVDPRSWSGAYLPQGAPTSPAISNLICRGLDNRLTGLAARNEGVYTRYADDLTFSFKADVPNLGRFRWWVDQICHQEGFIINHHKFRVIRSSQRQVVTGIVVNDTLRVPRPDRRRFRAILHNCEKHGLASQARDREPLAFAAYLQGFASYINMVHPAEGAELLSRVNALLDPKADAP